LRIAGRQLALEEKHLFPRNLMENGTFLALKYEIKQGEISHEEGINIRYSINISLHFQL
jgi:hypothetical protein